MGEEPRLMDDPIAAYINIACEVAFANSKAKGFWDGDQNLGEKIALMHSELSELLEAARHNTLNHQCSKGIGLTNAEEECADLFIRLADFCGAYGVDLGYAVKMKHQYNTSRPHKHGKTF